MRIGITMRNGDSAKYAEKRDALSKDWTTYLGLLFPDAIIIPLLNRPMNIIKTMKELRIDRVILSNGGDWGLDIMRDSTEKKLLAYCIKHRIPILGVCRGMQVLNVLFGGRLENDVQEKTGHEHRKGTIHAVEIIAKTPFSKFTKKKTMSVNSYHHQGVTASGIARPLKIFAQSSDRLVEGLYHPTKPIVGIQWHPERKNPSANFDKKVITNLFKK